MQVGMTIHLDSSYVLEFSSSVRFVISFPERAIYHQFVGPEVSGDTFDHLLHDQVLPRVISHDGALVLHGGGVAINDRAVAIMAPTGSGKSTLSASLQRAGHSLLGDDALILDQSENGFTLSAVYPSLRLLPDSIAALFGAEAETRLMAQHSDKRHVVVKATEPTDVTVPLAALIFLAAPGPHVCLRRITVAEACISLIANSFALDPTDRVWAADNMKRASTLAAHVPAYTLSYPRDYTRLPDVHAAIVGILHDQAA